MVNKTVKPKRFSTRQAFSRRRDRARALIKTMRERRRQNRMQRRLAPKASMPRRMSKRRKATLLVSAGAMGMSTAAQYVQPMQVTTIERQVAYYDQLEETRVDASELRASEAFKEALIEEEGVRETVYRDVAGYPTVGVGHLVTKADNLRVGDRVSYDQILDFLEQDLKAAEAATQRLAGDLPLFQHEFDALLDLVYNVGEGNVSERKSPKLNTAIASGDYAGIAAELDYHHAGGSKANGLVNRSERRTAIFMDANYENPREVA
ncbi:Lysozyme [Alteripontixanthobacter maritimus]|uniref:Lysozyme n=1 Tax=Alteripontixanthobacter maritimus TaxID=2161824 RepID=A0A369QD75_9SPHN|nr:lysozyme [Alteripontixanthobacter maritimus]RDC60238.1 Lysozyme [Alteripontixanthobacter maritimus]